MYTGENDDDGIGKYIDRYVDSDDFKKMGIPSIKDNLKKMQLLQLLQFAFLQNIYDFKLNDDKKQQMIDILKELIKNISCFCYRK